MTNQINQQVSFVDVRIYDSGVIARPDHGERFVIRDKNGSVSVRDSIPFSAAPFEVEGATWDEDMLGWWFPNEVFGNLPVADYASFAASRVGVPLGDSSMHAMKWNAGVV